MATTSTTASTVPDFRPDDPSSAWTLLSQGAEARVWKQGAVVCKERFPKRYRHPTLDERLTKARCRMEARMLQKCAKLKKNDSSSSAVFVAVPDVLRTEHSLIYMEFVEGESVRKAIDQHLAAATTATSSDNKIHNELSDLAKQLGQALACLHNQGMVHGDLTTSNMILRPLHHDHDHTTTTELVLIDFGLAKHSTSVEEKAVDLYVLERAMASTHASLPPDFWATVLRVYSNASENNKNEQSRSAATSTSSGRGKKQDTLARLEQVRQRGRKRECFG